MFLQRVERRLNATLPDNSTFDVISLDSLKMGMLRISGRQGKGSFLPTGAVSEKTLSASQRDGKPKGLVKQGQGHECARQGT